MFLLREVAQQVFVADLDRIGETAKVVLVALGVFFPLYLNTYHGVRTTDPALKEVGRVYGLSSYALFRRVIFPSALPSILIGLRFALGTMWLVLIGHAGHQHVIGQKGVPGTKNCRAEAGFAVAAVAEERDGLSLDDDDRRME